MRIPVRALVAAAITFLASACGESAAPAGPSGAIALTVLAPAGSAPRGTSLTVPVTIARSGGYSGSVALTAESVPTGVTAAFAPASLAGTVTSSVLTLDVGASATPGTYSLGLRARGDGVTGQIVQYSLTIPAPAITLVSSPAPVTMVQGAVVTVPVTIARLNAFTGPVELAVAGVPGGLTAVFAPATIGAGVTTSTLSLTAANNATIGTVTLTITASGVGVSAQTASFGLTILPGQQADYSLTATPAALAVVAGQSVQSTLGINRIGNFAGAVSLTVSGAPTGMTPTITPANTTGSSAVLTLATTPSIVAGTYTVTVRANTEQLPERTLNVSVTVSEAPGLVLGIRAAALSIPQSQARTVAISLTRTGGLTGAVALALEGAPAGVSGSFSPASVTGDSSTLTVVTTSAAVPGTYPLSLRGTGTGGVTASLPIALTVTPASYTLSANPASVTLSPGTSATTTISLARDAGFTGTVALSITNVPVGTTAVFAPSSVTGNSAEVTVTANAGTLIGPTTATITGKAAGRADETLSLTINIVPPVAGAGDITFRFCDPARVPIVFAYRNGPAGAWTSAPAGAGGSFVATITRETGSIAYVWRSGVVTRTDVFSGTVAELQQFAALECIARPAAAKSYSTVVSGIGGVDQVALSIGSAFTLATNAQPIAQFTGVPAGPQDLFATRLETIVTSTLARVPNRMLLRRAVDEADGTMLPAIDMASTEAFVPASSTLTLENGLGQPLIVGGLLLTATGPAAIATYAEPPATEAVRQYFGLPTPRLGASDLQGVLASATGSGTSRTVQTYYRSLADRALAFGAELGAPTFASTNVGGLAFPRVSLPITGEYGTSATATFAQNNVAVSVVATRGFFGAATDYTLEVPDLSVVAGFLAEYALAQGLATQTVVTASGASGFGGGHFGSPTIGSTVRSASRGATRVF